MALRIYNIVVSKWFHDGSTVGARGGHDAMMWTYCTLPNHAIMRCQSNRSFGRKVYVSPHHTIILCVQKTRSNSWPTQTNVGIYLQPSFKNIKAVKRYSNLTSHSEYLVWKARIVQIMQYNISVSIA